MKTLGDMIERNAVNHANAEALVYGERRYTHRQFADRVRRLAAAFFDLGLRRQERVSCLAMNCSEFLEVYGAGELAGYIVATVNFRLAAPEMAYIIKDSAPKILVFEAQYAEVVGGLRPQLSSIEQYVCIGKGPDWALSYEDVLGSGAPTGPPIRATEDDYVHLIYTSGTTGRPKGVIRGQREDVRVAETLGVEMNVTVDGRMQLMMPLFHVGSKFLQLAQHWRGGAVILHRTFDPVEVLQTIERERVTLTHMAPTMVQALLNVPDIGKYDVKSLDVLCYSAAPMPVSLLRKGLAILGPVFLQLYGMTEGAGTTLHKHQHRPDGTALDIKRLGSVGQAAPRVEIRIVDDAGVDCALSEPGEVWLRSDTMLSSYWNNAPATINALRDGWYHTGDVGYLDDEGFLFLVDRKKDMIISGGENIYSREVEEALASHPDVVDAAVIGVADAHWGEAVKAIVVRAGNSTIDEAALIEHCRTLIASYKKPKSIEYVDELPRLPSGKINKVVLRERYRKR